MKKVIDGVTYDTDVAYKIGSYRLDESDYVCRDNVVYLQGRQLFIHWTINSWNKEGIYLIGEQKPVVQDYRDYWEEE